MAPNFQHLLNKPAETVKKKSPLPGGNYNGIIVTHKFDESRQRKTPFVQFELRLQSAGDDVDQEALMRALDGRALSQETRRKDFYLTDDALWRLKEFMESLGISSTGRTLNEMLPETTAKSVIIQMLLKPSDRTDAQGNPEFFNEVGLVTGAA